MCDILNEHELAALEQSSGDDCDMAAVKCVVRELRAIRAERDAARTVLARMMWRSVADQSDCTCSGDDECPECAAFRVLGLGRWNGVVSAKKALSTLAAADAGKGWEHE